MRADYKSPTLTIPFAATPPKIDGVIDEAEWQGAFSANALQTTEGNVSLRPTTFWLEWDADDLYLAMRSPLRDGERVLQANRQTDRDNSKTVFDDSYEIWLNANTTSPNGEIVFFQYLGNVAGAFYDVMFEPTVGNSRPGWNSGWKPVSRITPDGKSWEMELAIPRKSIYRNTPFADGDLLHGLIVRNFKRPWEQNNLGGSGSFSAPDSHCKYVLSKSAPAIHLLGVADPTAKTFGMSIAGFSKDATTLKWSYESDGGAKKTGDLVLTPGKPTALPSDLNLDKPGDGFYRIHITDDDGKTTLLDWCSRRAFAAPAEKKDLPHDTGDVASLSLVFNPVHNYVRVAGDFINYDNRADLKRFQATVVDSAGKVLVDRNLPIDSLSYVQGVLNLPACPAGEYVAKLTCYDIAGKVLIDQKSPFTMKDAAKEFAWWNTTAGNIEKVIAPWTPVASSGDAVDVWGREMRIGAAGLPAQVTTQKEDLLVRPVSLVAKVGGETLSAFATAATPVSAAGNRVVERVTDHIGDLDITSDVTVEFDGMYKVAMTITPKKPTTVDAMKIVVPMKPEAVNYYHLSGEGIRYGFAYGNLPADKQGRLFGSDEVDGQPMLAGSFVPFIWLGNDHSGLCWFANSDEGWSPDAKTPAIEIRRDSADSVDLVLNLIGSQTMIDKPRTITFAFQATPTKPMASGWRMATWWTNDTFRDFCCVEPKGGHLIWNALPFTLDPAKCKQMVEERHNSDQGNFGLGKKYHSNAVPYFENNGMDKKFVPESDYFSDEWHARVSDSLCYGKTLTDYLVYSLGHWCEQTGIDGWYVDNIRPVACDNIDAGRGYLLPDGRVQPSYQIFETREQFLRTRAVFAEHGKQGNIVLHMTNNMVIPIIGAADIALDGEDHVIFPDMGKDFMDFWSKERLRLDYYKQWGVPVSFLQEYQGNWKADDLHRVMRAYTGMCLLNDILPSANPNGQNRECWQARDKFGIEADDVTFIPYWTPANGMKTDNDGVSVSAWQRPGKVLLAVVNTAEAGTPTVQLDRQKLGLAGAVKAIDAETGEVLAVSDAGAITLPIKRHDYRQVIIEATP